MAAERTAILFCPPLPPLRLGRKRPVFVGRHPSCDLAIRQHDVSRRHAEIRFQDGSYVVYDLESTNGTFLNGERLEGMRSLRPGDRIEIGSSTITFCEIEQAVSPDWSTGADEASTVICERTPAESARFSGVLAEVPAPAVFQLLEMGSNSGLLEIDSDDGTARVWFDMGRPVHAETEKCVGFDAALGIVSLTEGRFRFGPSSEPHEATIRASVTELLLEACRLQDEAARD